jgi:hypothetical protein
VSDRAKCEVVGRWRITGSDMWDRDFLDAADPPHLTLEDAGRGEIELGAVHLDLTVEHGRQIVFFRFSGFDEDNEVWGDRNAKIADDGTLEIHIGDGDEAALTAKRETSSAACFMVVLPKRKI